MTDLDQNALGAAVAALRFNMTGVWTEKTMRSLVSDVIEAYLAARRERWLEKTAGTGSHEAVDEFLPDLVEVRGDRIIDADLYDVRRAIAIAITAAVEEEREAVAHFIESVCVGTCDERFGLCLAAAIRFRSSRGEK